MGPGLPPGNCFIGVGWGGFVTADWGFFLKIIGFVPLLTGVIVFVRYTD